MRVLVCRAAAQGEETVRRLAERGYEGISIPLTRIVDLPSEPPLLAADALIVTSANAVPALSRRLHRLGHLPTLAVGDRTAEALRKAGMAAVVSASGDARAVADVIARSFPLGSTLLHVAGRDRHPEPSRALTEAGFRVVPWEVYAAEAVARLPAELARELRERRLGTALHYSARSADTLLKLASAAGCEAELRALSHVCLSPEVAQALSPLRADRVSVAAAPTEDALLAALGEAGQDAGFGAGSPSPPGRC